MAEFEADLLERPAAQATRVIARAFLDDAAAAAARLANPEDADALHDFRVAVRRLRVTIRAYPELRRSLPKKQRRRLRKIARTTNRGRDAEVQIAWFRDRSARFTAAQRAALRSLRARLATRRREEQARTHTDVQARFQKLERKLRRILEPGADVATPGPRMGALAGPTIRRHAVELRDRLASARAADKAAEIHAGRIAAKRLRYLLEPLAAAFPACAPLLRKLKSLQDVLGQLTDAHVLESELQERPAQETSAPGIAAAKELLHAEVAQLFAKLEAEWLVDGVADLQRDVDLAATQIARGGSTADVRTRPRRRRRRHVPA